MVDDILIRDDKVLKSWRCKMKFNFGKRKYIKKNYAGSVIFNIEETSEKVKIKQNLRKVYGIISG